MSPAAVGPGLPGDSPSGDATERPAASRQPPLLAVALGSAAGLAYEILLLRLFSIVQYHHTAYMVISLALLGYGASGSALALGRQRWRTHFGSLFGISLTLFAASAVGCFAVAQRIVVHPEELLWRPRQMVWLLIVYLLLALPFFFVGTAVGAALMRFSTSRVYAGDLLGAGVGTFAVVGLLWSLSPGGALRAVATLAVLAALAGDRQLDLLSARRGASMLSVALLVWLLPASWVEPRPSPYKGLSQALRVEGAELVEQRSSPLALVSVVENHQIPLRHAPGLSLAVPVEPPEQIGVFLDAEALLPIVRWEAGSERLAYLGYSTAALPYAISEPQRVLVLGAGGGEEVARARWLGASSILGVEINPDVVDLVRGRYDEFSGRLYSRAGVEIEIDDVRGFAARHAADATSRRFDLVVLAAVGGYGGGGPALAALSESYLSTIEAFDQYLDLLSPNGLLAATTFLENPPRDGIKLAATAIRALERRGEEDPARSLAMIRSWQTSTLVVKRGSFDAAELARLRRFASRRLFDPVFFPGMREEEANRHNRVAEPILHRAVVALLGSERESFLERYQFMVRPATDDRPFFHQFFRWRSLPQIAAARGSGGLSLLEAGYLVLVATLILAVGTSLVLVVGPLVVGRGAADGRSWQPIRGRVAIYFGGLGLGFLLLEVAFLERLILVLQHPVYAAAVVLAGFLVFAGLGSAAAPVLERHWRDRTVRRVGVAIICIGGIDLGLLSVLSGPMSAASMPIRVIFSLALVAPLAFFMGMPFPLGLGRLRGTAAELEPWAWAINGCASVVSPILATLIAVHAGFDAVILIALGAYGVVALTRLVATPQVPPG